MNKILFSVILFLELFFLPNTEIYARNDEPSKGQPTGISPEFKASDYNGSATNSYKSYHGAIARKNVDVEENYKTLYWYAEALGVKENQSKFVIAMEDGPNCSEAGYWYMTYNQIHPTGYTVNTN